MKIKFNKKFFKKIFKKIKKLKKKNLKKKNIFINSYKDENKNNDCILDKIFLIQQFFIPNNVERYNEIKKCLNINYNNKDIDKIILLNEKIYSDLELGINNYMDKIIQININKRLSFFDVFNYVEKNLKGYVIFCNSDIYFDKTINNIFKTSLKKKRLLYTQKRIEVYNYIKNDILNPGQQDTWIYHSNNKINNKDIFKFNFGVGGCDNKLAYLLYKNEKFNLCNDPLYIKTFHLHKMLYREWRNKERLKAPHLFIYPLKTK